MSVHTMTVPSARLLTDLVAGDRIVAIDAHDLRQPREVEIPRVATRFGGPEGVRLVNALGTSTEWMLYPGNVEHVTIERDVEVIQRRAVEHVAARLDADGDPIPRNHREAFGYAWKKTLDRMGVSTGTPDRGEPNRGEPVEADPEQGEPDRGRPDEDEPAARIVVTRRERKALERTPEYVDVLRMLNTPDGAPVDFRTRFEPGPESARHSNTLAARHKRGSAGAVSSTAGYAKAFYGWTEKVGAYTWRITPRGRAALAAHERGQR